jgi:hypothetical protein
MKSIYDEQVVSDIIISILHGKHVYESYVWTGSRLVNGFEYIYKTHGFETYEKNLQELAYVCSLYNTTEHCRC